MKRYLVQALESVLGQETDFTFEVVIGDDGSTDNTQKILEAYAQNHPEKIQLRLNEQNQGVFRNVENTLKACTGKYIALLEGDDYWVSMSKLQEQVNFLETHEEYTGCFHDTEILWEENEDYLWEENYFRLYSQLHNYSPEFKSWRLLRRVIIPTSSLVVRSRDYFDELSRFSNTQFSLSWVIAIILMKKNLYEHGKFFYINKVWSVYRKHKKGATSRNKRAAFIHANIQIMRELMKDPAYKNDKQDIYWSVAKEYENLFFLYKTRKEQKEEDICNFPVFEI